MTAEEIVEAGITTGCKKVLDKISLLLSNDKSSAVTTKETKQTVTAGIGTTGSVYEDEKDSTTQRPPRNAFELMAQSGAGTGAGVLGKGKDKDKDPTSSSGRGIKRKSGAGAVGSASPAAGTTRNVRKQGNKSSK